MRLISSNSDNSHRAARRALCMVVATACLLLPAPQATAYIEAAYSLGRLVNESTGIALLRVESVDREKNLIVYRKVRDIKGTAADTIKHNIGRGGFHPREWQNVMAWAQVGQIALFFNNGGAGETCIDGYWYQVYAGDWWAFSHGEPFLLRTFSGRPEKLAAAVTAMLSGQEVTVPCMVDGDKNALALRTARIQRMRASLKIQDYNQARDFAGWGGEDFLPLVGMPGFTHLTTLVRIGPRAAGASAGDFDGDGKADLCLFGDGRLAVLANSGGTLSEVALPPVGPARAAEWADFDGDGKLDLLLASPLGPRLLAGDGSTFKDISERLPRLPYHHLTAAAWIDYDCDKRPDILLADGFAGLRLLRNLSGDPPQAPVAGAWHYVGPFENTDGSGFAVAYPPEKGVELSANYVGKNNQEVSWKKGDFADGEVNSLMLFQPADNQNSTVYLYRQIECPRAMDLPVSLGSDDSLKVWLNNELLHAEDVARGCAPDQVKLTLKLRAGTNRLLLKIGQLGGEWAFYYKGLNSEASTPVPAFEDVSDEAGLGRAGLAGELKGDRIAVADVNGDSRADFLFSAGNGVLAINTPRGFVAAADSGISYKAGDVTPAFGDFDGDGRVDLFVPQVTGPCKLYRNVGGGRFEDVSTRSQIAVKADGPWAISAAWFPRPGGRPDLIIGCLRGPNRWLRNNDDGTFTDVTVERGLHKRIFNSAGVCATDINGDGTADIIFVNEGGESSALLVDPKTTER